MTAPALARAGRLLATRARSEHELRSRLIHAGHSADEVDDAIDRLKAARIVDDAEFAVGWIERRAGAQPRSAEALLEELRGRGVDDDTARAALERCGHADQLQARRAAAQALDRLARLPLDVQARRLHQLLLRRGFDDDTAVEAVRAVLPPEGWD